MATVERILIVGGGIAGLTLATALQQQGFRPELVERSPEWRAIGAGIMLQANGLRMLRALGLDVPVEQAGAVVHHWAWCNQQGDVLSDTDLVGVWGEVGPCVGIARPALQQVLLAGAAAVPCRLGTAITSLTQTQEEQGHQHGQQRVRVGFSDGSSGEYDLVVGADGLGSSVRELALGTASIGYTGVMVWRSIVPLRSPGVNRSPMSPVRCCRVWSSLGWRPQKKCSRQPWSNGCAKRPHGCTAAQCVNGARPDERVDSRRLIWNPSR